MLVDRYFASQKVMAVMHLAGAAILWFVPQALVAQNGALLIGLTEGRESARVSHRFLVPRLSFNDVYAVFLSGAAGR